MVDVFISYSRTNKDQVAQLARAIEAEGYAVWWDAELPPHQSYGDVITAKIAAAKAAIVVWSPEAAASEWVRAEADMARNQKKLVQTALGDIMPPLPFNQIQYANIGDWQGEADHPGWAKVKTSLRELCGEREGGAAIPAAPPPAAQPLAASVPPAASKTPLYAGLGVGAVAIALAAGWVIGQNGGSDDDTPSAGNTEIVDTAVENGGIDDGFNREVMLRNSSGDTIMYLYWSSTEDQSWGADRLGTEVLPAGQPWQVVVEDGTGSCNFDFLARLPDGREITRANVNVCRVSEISFQ